MLGKGVEESYVGCPFHYLLLRYVIFYAVSETNAYFREINSNYYE